MSRRIKELQTGNPDKLECVLKYEIAGYKFVEVLLKHKYEDKKVEEGGKEWYYLSETDIQDIKIFFEKHIVEQKSSEISPGFIIWKFLHFF